MPLTITAQIVDQEGKPLIQHDAQVCIFGLAGVPKLLVAGRTDDLGRLSLLAKWVAPADYQPRLQLQLMRGLAFAEASENPGEFVDGSCDFGKVTFNPNLVLPRLSDTSALLARITTLEAEKAALIAQHALALAARTNELDAQRQAEKDALTQQYALALAARDAQVHELDQQLQVANSDIAPETTIEDLAQSTAEQLQRVRQTLQNGQSGLRLGKVGLQLKVLPGRTGGRVALPQSRQIQNIGAQALGSLDLAFIPETTAPVAAARPQLTTPRVLGYTETLARRKLAERRLGVEIVYRLVTSAAEHGRVVLQRPEPEAPVAEGTVVLIAIGRQDEHDPRPS